MELNSKSRNALSSSEFVFPSTRRYPIHDLSHAKNALARSSGTLDEAKVHAAVHRKYPGMGRAKAISKGLSY